MHSLAQRVLSHIRRQELLRAGDRVGVAVSGGIDSVALLRLLLELRGELGIVLSLVHFNHKLRGSESDADQEFVAALARAHDLEFFWDSDDVAQHAAEEHVSVESAARELRYGFFWYLLGESGPQGLKPSFVENPSGTAEAVPFPISQGLKPDSDNPPLRGPEGPLFHGNGQSEEPSVRARAEGPLFHGNGQSEEPSVRGRAEGPIFHGNGQSEEPSVAVSKLDKIVTGHTLDDQAETVLMHLIRGTGLRGLGAIHPRVLVQDDDGEVCGEIVRPLLEFRRRELEHYLDEIRQNWREDSTNADTSFTRNRVRKLVVPLLEKEFNPAVAENLAELAEIARGEEDYWENEVAGWMGTAVHWSEPEWARALSKTAGLVQIAAPGIISGETHTSRAASFNQIRAREMGHPAAADGTAEAVPVPNPDSTSGETLRQKIDSTPWLVMNASVDRLWFLGEPVAVQRRLTKAIGEEAGIPLAFKHVEEILHFAAEEGGAGKELSLPLGWKVVREQHEFVFVTPDLREPTPQQDYEYSLPIPGRTAVFEAGITLEARLIPAAAVAGYNLDHLLDAQSLPGPLTVRNWRPGDRFWPVHTKSPKKIKELLQGRHVAQPERRLWPVVARAKIAAGEVAGDEVVWLRGFPASARFQAKPGSDAILIVETPLAEGAVT